MSERLGAALAPAVGKGAATVLLSRATATAEETGRDLLAVLRKQPELAGHPLAGTLDRLLDPADYTGASARLAARAARRARDRASNRGVDQC